MLRKLAAQARTRHELAKALAAKEVPEDVAEAVLDRMEEVGLVDDGPSPADWVESRQQRRHLSRSALRRELQTKGVDRDQIEEASPPVDGEDELTAARRSPDEAAPHHAGPEREVRYRRLAGALARRGFSGSVASTVLSQVLDDPARLSTPAGRARRRTGEPADLALLDRWYPEPYSASTRFQHVCIGPKCEPSSED